MKKILLTMAPDLEVTFKKLKKRSLDQKISKFSVSEKIINKKIVVHICAKDINNYILKP